MGVDLILPMGTLRIPLSYGGYGEAVNASDCDSDIRGFDPL